MALVNDIERPDTVSRVSPLVTKMLKATEGVNGFALLSSVYFNALKNRPANFNELCAAWKICFPGFEIEREIGDYLPPLLYHCRDNMEGNRLVTFAAAGLANKQVNHIKTPNERTE